MTCQPTAHVMSGAQLPQWIPNEYELVISGDTGTVVTSGISNDGIVANRAAAGESLECLHLFNMWITHGAVSLTSVYKKQLSYQGTMN